MRQLRKPDSAVSAMGIGMHDGDVGVLREENDQRSM